MNGDPLFYESDRFTAPYPEEDPPVRTGRRVYRRSGTGPVSRVWQVILCAGAALLLILAALAAGWYSRLPAFRAAQALLPGSGLFADGTYVDNIPLSGLTYQQALNRLTVVGHGEKAGTVTVTAGEQGWTIPVSRFYDDDKNIRDALDKAWAVGRSVTQEILPEGLSPFEYRRRSAETARDKGAYYYVSGAWRPEIVAEAAAEIAGDINREPVSAELATFDFSTESFTFLPERNGYSIRVSDIETAIAKALGQYDTSGAAGDVALEPRVILPEITSYDLMNSFGPVSAAVARLDEGSQDLLRAVDGVIIPAGNEISLFNIMLQRLTGNGVSREGLRANLYAAELSGVGDLVFRAASSAELTIVKHSADQSGNTVIRWPDEDLILRNDSAYPVYLSAQTGKDPCTLTVYGRIPNH